MPVMWLRHNAIGFFQTIYTVQMCFAYTLMVQFLCGYYTFAFAAAAVYATSASIVVLRISRCEMATVATGCAVLGLTTESSILLLLYN